MKVKDGVDVLGRSNPAGWKLTVSNLNFAIRIVLR
jgi:hypothetical protein